MGISWTAWSQRMLSVLRIVVAFLYITHGTMKLFGYPTVANAPPTLPEPFSLYWFAGVIETVGGSLLLLGLLTRPVAFLTSGEMAVAYFKVHAPMATLPIQNHGELPVLFSFIWLYFALAGPGPWSLDALIRRKPAAATDYTVRG